MIKNHMVYRMGLLLIILMIFLSMYPPRGITYHLEIDKKKDNSIDEALAFICYDNTGFSDAKYLRYQQLKEMQVPGMKIITSASDNNDQTTTPCLVGDGGILNSSWPMQSHDIHHTGKSLYSTANTTDLEKWRLRADWGVDGGMAIDNNGIVYFGAKDRNLYAVYPNGTLKWRYKTEGWIESIPALGYNGTIYFGSWDYGLYALNPNGTRKWRFGAGGAITYSSPTISNDGTIYVGTHDPSQSLIAVYPNGTEKWRYRTGAYITSSPAIDDNEIIYVGSADTYFYSLYPNGTLRWRFKTGDRIMGSPSIADDGTVYIGSFDGYLYALYPENGSMLWRCPIGIGTKVNPSLGTDGTIYVGCDALYAVNPNGTTRWTFNMGTDRYIIWSSPAISADGTIYVGTNIGEVTGGEIIAVNTDGTEQWRKRIAYEWVDSSPAIASDGTVYIGSQYDIASGYLHAFGPVESNSPPEAPAISGETNGKMGTEYWYGIRAFDPDNNPISFYIDWGDDTTTGWTREHASGELHHYEHTWQEEGDYIIKAKTRDVFGNESDWGTLEVTMPVNQQNQHPLFSWFFNQNSRLLPLIKSRSGLQ